MIAGTSSKRQTEQLQDTHAVRFHCHLQHVILSIRCVFREVCRHAPLLAVFIFFQNRVTCAEEAEEELINDDEGAQGQPWDGRYGLQEHVQLVYRGTFFHR